MRISRRTYHSGGDPINKIRFWPHRALFWWVLKTLADCIQMAKTMDEKRNTKVAAIGALYLWPAVEPHKERCRPKRCNPMMDMRSSLLVWSSETKLRQTETTHRSKCWHTGHVPATRHRNARKPKQEPEDNKKKTITLIQVWSRRLQRLPLSLVYQTQEMTTPAIRALQTQHYRAANGSAPVLMQKEIWQLTRNAELIAATRDTGAKREREPVNV